MREPEALNASSDDRVPPSGTFKAWVKKSWLEEATALGLEIPTLLDNDYAFRPILQFRVPACDLDDDEQEQWADDEGDSLEDDFAELFEGLESFAQTHAEQHGDNDVSASVLTESSGGGIGAVGGDGSSGGDSGNIINEGLDAGNGNLGDVGGTGQL